MRTLGLFILVAQELAGISSIMEGYSQGDAHNIGRTSEYAGAFMFGELLRMRRNAHAASGRREIWESRMRD
jgi:hypothetical protein